MTTKTKPERRTKAIEKFVLPAGEYYLADPCYVLPRGDYDYIIDHLNEQLIHLKDGTSIALFHAEGGDNIYADKTGRHYAVDSGTIAAIPIQIGAPDSPQMEDRQFFHRVNFERDFKCFDDNGVLHFGQVEINTRENGDE